jgi:hypothetical protein
VKISRDYPQFNTKSALIVVGGDVSAKLLFAFNGKIDELETVRPHEKDYPDKMGYSRVMGRGVTFSRESFNAPENWQHDEFIDFLKERMAYFIRDLKPDEIFIFEKEDTKRVVESLPREYQKKVAGTFSKNYINEHPFKVLRFLDDYLTKGLGKSVPVKEEARKILEKGND